MITKARHRISLNLNLPIPITVEVHMKGFLKFLSVLLTVFTCIHSTYSYAQIFKCREADGAVLYTDTPCGKVDAQTISYMPVGSNKFMPASESSGSGSDSESDSEIQEEVTALSGEEADLGKELDDIQAAPGESMNASPMAHAQRLAIMSRLKEIRTKKNLLLGRGLSKEDQEELVSESETAIEEDY
jgi:hypothetical protein